MRSSSRLLFSLLFVIAPALRATGETRLLAASDKDAAAVVAAVTEFRTAIADGKADAARALFAGDADNARILSAFLDWANAGERLRAALETKYDPANFPKALFVSKNLHAQLDAIKYRIVVINGDRASISSASLFDRGMRLGLFDGKWKVTHLAGRPVDVETYGQLIRAMADKYEAAESDYASGKLKSLEDVLERLLKLSDSEREPLLATSRLRRQLPLERLPHPAKWQPPTPDVLLKLVGAPAPSNELTRLYSSLPGIPLVEGSEESVSIFDDEGGIEFMQELKPKPRLFRIDFFARGTFGCAQYQGELPFGLNFADTRADVERKLGRPPIVGGGGTEPIDVFYPALGLTVEYTKPAGRDPMNTISLISAGLPDPKGESAPAANAPQIKPRIAFRLVAKDPGEKDIDLVADPSKPAGPKLPIAKKVLIDESAIARVNCVFALKPTETNQLGIEMTEEGARQFKSLTTENTGRTLALMFDGTLIVAAKINGPLPGNITLGLPNSPSASEIVHLSGRMNAAVQALPDAPPAKKP